MAKMYMTELSNKIVDKCLQMYGGYGYMEDFPIARAYRDARVGTIVGGTTQIMKEILAKIIIDDIRYKKVYQEEVVENSKPWGNPQTAKEIIYSIPLRIKKDKAANYSTIFNFDISGNNGGQYHVIIENGNATVSEQLHANATCTITADDETYANVELGKLDPTAAFMAGQIKVDNLQAMMQFSKMFNRI
jgi:hypothetical protein